MSSLMFETSRWRCFQRQVGWVSIFAVNTQSLDTPQVLPNQNSQLTIVNQQFNCGNPLNMLNGPSMEIIVLFAGVRRALLLGGI